MGEVKKTQCFTNKFVLVAGWSNANRRWEHGGALGGQHGWPGGRHQAGDQLGCQVGTIERGVTRQRERFQQ